MSLSLRAPLVSAGRYENPTGNEAYDVYDGAQERARVPASLEFWVGRESSNVDHLRGALADVFMYERVELLADFSRALPWSEMEVTIR